MRITFRTARFSGAAALALCTAAVIAADGLTPQSQQAVGAVEVSDTQGGLLRAIEAPDAMTLDRAVEHHESAVVRSRFVGIDVEMLPRVIEQGEGLRGGVELTLDLFEDVSLPVVLTDVAPGAPTSVDGRVLIGHIDGMQGSSWVFLSINGEIVIGDVYGVGIPTRQIRYVRPGLHEVRQIDEALLPACGNGPEQSVDAGGLNAPVDGLAQTPVEPMLDVPVIPPHRFAARVVDSEGERGEFTPLIDVLMVYTPAAGDLVGGHEAMEAVVASWAAQTNNSYLESGAAQRLRLIGPLATDYAESNSASTDLGRLAGTTDGFMDEVHAIRNAVGADLVHLISRSAGVCGIAYLMANPGPGFASTGFGLTVVNCGALTFAHEIGHNAGCAHDRDNAGSAAYCYSYGYRTPNNQFRTIMAYAPGTRVPIYSSPELTWSGFAMGISGDGCPPNSADNVRTLDNTASILANFRDEVIPSEPEPFELVSPAMNALSATLRPTLTWQTSPSAQNYIVRLAHDPEMTNIIDESTRFGASYALPSGMLNWGDQVYWSVQAVNFRGVTDATPEVAAFRVRALADMSVDGVVNSIDLGVVLGSWGPCPAAPASCLADLDGDGVVSSSDMAILLGSWGDY